MPSNVLAYGSVCSGIEAASVAWGPLGWTPSWFAEIEPFPSAVLAHHWPAVRNLGDMTGIAKEILSGEIHAPDVLVGGTPCQAFSIAGMRKGLSDERGQLTLEYVRLADAIDRKRTIAGSEPVIIVWENVPGVLTSKDNAFGCFLAALAGEDEELQPAGKKWSNAGCVFGPSRTVAWRILDAQYFGVAQRRRRVFVVASARKNFDPSAVLFEFEGVRRDSAPSRKAGQETAGTLASRTGAGGFPGTDEACSGYIQPVGFRMVAFGEYADDGTASTMKARDYKDATDLSVSVVHGTQDPIVGNDIAHCLGRNSGQENAVLAFNAKDYGADATIELSPTLRAGNSNHSRANSGNWMAIQYQMEVRRLIPMECERLQGFPDNYTLIPIKGKPSADGPRYKALGNSMAVPCMAWIGRRIQKHLVSLSA